MILNWLLAVLSSILLVVLFPRFSFGWLAPVALTPLLIACAREPNWRWRLAFGYVCGFVYWLGLCNWVQSTLVAHADMGAALAWFLMALFCLAKAVQMGVFAALVSPALLRLWIAPPCVAALWVAMEWTHAFTGLQWLNLGNAASDMSLLLRLAPVTGVWGLSFVFALMSAVIAAVILRRPRLASIWLLPVAFVFGLPEIPAPERGTASAIVVQPNIDDETQWSTELVSRTEQELYRLSVAPIGSSAAGSPPVDVVVWPEMPGPFYENDARYIAWMAAVAKFAHAGVIAGAVGRTSQRMPLNSALTVGSTGEIVGRYDKVNLVPFGEFVPWPFGALTQKVSTEAGDFVPGSKVVVSPLNGHRVATFICYESAFPGYVRRFVSGGAEALVNISNDSWFGTTQARYQHLRLARMRAVENRRWIIRATNDGVSGAIDPAGRVVATAPEYRAVTSRMRYGYRQDLTFYTRFGDWFVAVCALAAAGGLVTAALPRQPGSLR